MPAVMKTGLSGRSNRPAACARHRLAGGVEASEEAEAGPGAEARAPAASVVGDADGWAASGFAFERFEPKARP